MAESPVSALRDAFGDRRIPDISRKITACVACRKQKIKCQMPNSQPPCARCKKRGLSCSVNRSLQMLLENDAQWKYAMQDKVEKLESLVNRLIEQGHPASVPQNEGGGALSCSNNQEPPHEDTTPTDDLVIDLESGPSSIPGFRLPDAQSEQASHPSDFVWEGILSMQDAQRFFSIYRDRLDHFPYRILRDHGDGTFESLRKSSQLLALACCTVGALHANDSHFGVCYRKFVAQCQAQSLRRGNTVSDVRALCIGAFWLSDISWPLASMAVRIAMELQLHTSMHKALQGSRKHYFLVRLWLLVYVCDHHFSVAYGRPPMTRDGEPVKNVRSFAECEHATEDDARLASQVLRWSACSEIFDTFGPDVDRRLSEAEIPKLRRFSMALDSIRAEWTDRFNPNAHVGNYPNKGVVLQYHFAKLYLCSHAFRGTASTSGTIGWSADAAMELDEFRNLGVLAALSILRTVVVDIEIQSFLDGLPIYFDTMIAFAATFLYKVTRMSSISLKIDATEIKQLMDKLVATLQRIASNMHQKHLLVAITKGIENLAQRGNATAASPAINQDVVSRDISQNDLNWVNEIPFDAGLMNDFDFLMCQDMSGTWDFPLGQYATSSAHQI